MLSSFTWQNEVYLRTEVIGRSDRMCTKVASNISTRGDSKKVLTPWFSVVSLAVVTFACTTCASVEENVAAPALALLQGRAARADYMLDGLVGNTKADVSHNYLPPVPYPYFKYSY
jgi:hypothetical protein